MPTNRSVFSREPDHTPEPRPRTVESEIPPSTDESPLTTHWKNVLFYSVGGLALALFFYLSVAYFRGLDPIRQVIVALGLDEKERYANTTATLDGDVVTGRLVTDSFHSDTLCDQVMDEIYRLATKYFTAKKLVLSVETEKGQATVRVNDLDLVREFQQQEGYAASDHRAFVGEPLLEAGLASAESIKNHPAPDGDELAGYKYEIEAEARPRLGLKFLDSSKVEILADGVSTGICSYTRNGNEITIPTSCSTMHVHKTGPDTLEEMGMELRRK